VHSLKVLVDVIMLCELGFEIIERIGPAKKHKASNGHRHGAQPANEILPTLEKGNRPDQESDEQYRNAKPCDYEEEVGIEVTKVKRSKSGLDPKGLTGAGALLGDTDVNISIE
jgi:hypothetical protein